LLKIKCIVALIGVAALSGCIAQPPADKTAILDLESCRLHGSSGLTSVPAECGWFSVPENPADPNGTSIDLFVARIPALNPRFPDSAFTLLAGGPGQAASEVYADYSSLFERIHRYHDIVIVDQRGTGQSAALDCPVDETELLEFTVESAAEQAALCLEQLNGDPRYYTTSVAVADLDRVRDALGYQQLDIYGASYGTRVAQHYLKRYPGHTRTVVIDGVVPADLLLGPTIALDAQLALEKIFQRCADDQHCNTTFPDVEATFGNLADTLRASALELTLPSPLSGELTTITLDYTAFAGAVRLLSYTPATSALLPLLFHEASANENWAPLAAQAQMVVESLADAISEGMHNAVVCTEDVPFFAIDANQRAALAETYLGELQIDILVAICNIWPSGPIDEDFHEPVKSDVPVMLLSGTADPITPPRYATQAAEGLTNSLHIVADGHGHGVLTRNCVPELIAEFVASATLDDLDAKCVDKERPAPFFSSFSGPEP